MKRANVVLFVLVPVLALASAHKPVAAADKPNILFILADDLGYGEVGCYGQKDIQTPHIDRLAEQGMRFTDCYSGSTVCAPSRCSLMTGLHNGHARIRGNSLIPLKPQDVTVAEILKEAGYVTGVIGKWGLGEPDTTGIPNRQGFDFWFGYLNQGHAHNYYPTFLWRNEGKFTLRGNLNAQKEEYSHDLFTHEAIKFIERNRARPWFLYLPYTIPHANSELGRATGNGMEVPDLGPYEDRDWPESQKGLAAMITRMDRDIGRLMNRLKTLGIQDNTIVFFTSDNGPDKVSIDPEFFKSSGPLRGIKRDLYEGGIRVPMIVRWPGKVKAGDVSHQIWAFWDFLPTAADIAGVEPPTGIDGMSILPTLLGKKQKDHEFLYWEFYWHATGFMQAVRMGKWKAFRTNRQPKLELYDLSNDLAETTNIADQHPNIVAKIEDYLKTARTKYSMDRLIR